MQLQVNFWDTHIPQIKKVTKIEPEIEKVNFFKEQNAIRVHTQAEVEELEALGIVKFPPPPTSQVWNLECC
jgi:hypothetical protein